jgi:hypothetical protein
MIRSDLPLDGYFLPVLCGEGYTMFDCYGHWKFLSFRFFSKHIVKGLPLFFLDYGLLKRIRVNAQANKPLSIVV